MERHHSADSCFQLAPTPLAVHDSLATAVGADDGEKLATGSDEAAELVGKAGSFIEHATSRVVDPAECKVLARCDDAEQRASLSVDFQDGCVFKVSFEYGTHIGAARMSEEEMQALERDSALMVAAIVQRRREFPSGASWAPVFK